MKKLIFITVVILMAGYAKGQTLQKGTFLSLHVLTVNLEPNVTMNQFLEVYINKVLPEFEKYFECKEYFVKGIRGECKNCYGAIMVYKSEGIRDKYFTPEEGGLTELGQDAWKKMQPVFDELTKLGTYTTRFTDWILQ